MTTPKRITRRRALQGLAAGFAAPFVYRTHATAAPSETLYHASFGGSGMAASDWKALTASKNVKLVAVAEVDLERTAEVRKAFPDVKVYQDWRELLDKEKNLNSANVSTPDHMHAPIMMRCLQQGLNVYGQKPLTQTIHEARQLTLAAVKGGQVTQMGIQIHSHEVHRTVVATIQSGVLGKVKAVHSWSGKTWGDTNPRPKKSDPIPAKLDWNAWLGVAEEREFIAGYYHPGNWRKRLDFGTGTFGDMGCHILDPVYGSLALTSPTMVKSTGQAPNGESWGLETAVALTFPGTKFTTEKFELFWTNGEARPPAEVVKLIGDRKLSDQGSIYIGTEGVMYSPYIAMPVLLPSETFSAKNLVKLPGENHYLQFVEACRGNAKTSAPFAYAGPLTETVLLGCLATRFPNQELRWDATALEVTNIKEANRFVKKTYRKGWDVQGL